MEGAPHHLGGGVHSLRIEVGHRLLQLENERPQHFRQSCLYQKAAQKAEHLIVQDVGQGLGLAGLDHLEELLDPRLPALEQDPAHRLGGEAVKLLAQGLLQKMLYLLRLLPGRLLAQGDAAGGAARLLR